MSRASRRRRAAAREHAKFAAMPPAERAALMRADQRARAKDPARWGEESISPEREAELRAKGIEVKLDLRRRLAPGSHKQDVWGTLASRGGLERDQLEAIRRLERDMIERSGKGGGGFNGVVVDAAGDACAVTDRMVEAGRRVDAVLAMVGPPPSRLLRALIEPGVEGRSADWKAETHRITGETRPEAQSALLRYAAQSLLECYEAIDEDELRRRRAERERREYEERAAAQRVRLAQEAMQARAAAR